MAGTEIKRARRERFEAIAADKARIDELIDRVATGDSIRALAAELDVRYVLLWSLLSETHGEQLKRARKAAASALVDKNVENADRVDDGKLNPKAASVSARIREWTAAKWNRDEYGDRSAVDMRVTGTVDLNVQAIRALTGQTYDGELDAEDAQLVEDLDGHPLL